MKSDNYNIKPAERLQSTGEYYFSRKLREIASLRSQGHDIISLGIGGPDRPPHDSVIDTLCQEAHKATVHGYQNSGSIPELRQAFCNWYARHYDVTINPDNEILPLIGSKEGVLHISLAFLNPGDGVLIPNPGYPTYSSVSNLIGAKIFTYPLTEDNGWYPDFEALEQLPLEHIKLMWLNYTQMPTGAPATRELFERAVAFGKKHGIVIAHDNPYSFILNDSPMSIMQIPGAKEIALELNSLSKSHNMAGWRMAMVTSNQQFISWILQVKSNIDSGQFRPAMLAAVKALELPDSWYSELNQVYSERRKIAEQIMTALGCKYSLTQKGLFLWGKVPEIYPDGTSLADRLLYEADIFVTPGFIFGTQGKQYIRISLCADTSKLNAALNRIINLNIK
ncbi:MAG: aminotransferase class I/II-fold pyridoxal phosphate-dependent enzyme [Paramuribaculum sp.]|nr:aminotransferase class I/II-fold pyridoxal phosphate-dependent enzyme [Paramuribaculum sp.]